MAPVGPPPGCQTCFFLCAIVSKAKVQRELCGCRINVACPSTDFNIRPRNGPPGGAKRNSTSLLSPPELGGRPDRLSARCQLRCRRAQRSGDPLSKHKEQIATIRRPTCALMEKLKITTGLPLDHSTDSLASPGTGGVFIDYVNKLAPIAPAFGRVRNAQSRRGPRRSSSASSFFLITRREKRR